MLHPTIKSLIHTNPDDLSRIPIIPIHASRLQSEADWSYMLIDAKAAIVERTNGLGSPDAVFFSSVGHKDYFLRMFRQYPKIEKEIGIDACRYLTSDVLSSLLLVGTKKRHVILVCDSKFDPVDRAMAVVHITF